ncbi:MAG TPA: phytanoyl-CoA dioxygenase family protein [Planctomycetota bacterium]|nr:phytanoyl-CoA dioxygenase family protein [Planctomycetota bacterium]
MTLTSHAPGPLTERDAYFFDLHGAIIVRGALDAREVAACNRILDRLQHMKVGEWDGWVHGHNFGGGARDGLNLQQIFEAGEPFEALLDHPAWYEKVRAFVGGEGTFDYAQGPMFVDECFANLRAQGEAIPLHSGGFNVSKRCQFEVREGRFHCSQINVLAALNDIGPGDGATMVVPASHKSHFGHPQANAKGWGNALSVDGLECAVEVHLKAGDAVIFTDAIMHGSAARVNGGQRRNIVYRYGPSWGGSRHGYRASPEALARLTPLRRQLVQPLDPVLPPVAALAPA